MRHQILSNLQYVTSFFLYFLLHDAVFSDIDKIYKNIYCLFETSLVHTYYFLKVKDMIFFSGPPLLYSYTIIIIGLIGVLTEEEIHCCTEVLSIRHSLLLTTMR